LDKIAIHAVEQPTAFGDVFATDILGPVEVPSTQGHKYILLLLDWATGWPELAPLKGLTSKETCDALLRIWTRTGIPRLMVSDNCGNYKAELIQELYDRFGVEIRYSTPQHAEGNGRCERMIQVVKRMLHHLVKNTTQPGEWPQRLPWLEFCIREAPSSGRGVSPFEVLLGRPARGRLAVLKDSWSGEKKPETPVLPTTEKYLEEVREKLKRQLSEIWRRPSEK